MPGYLEDDPTLDYLDDPDNPDRVGAPSPVPPSPISAPPIDHPPGAGDSPTIREIMAQAQPQLNQQPPVAQDLGAAQKKQADVAAQRPTPSEPKWWQRLAAAGVGAAAGYTNAAGRAHVDPRAAENAIYDVPGQQRKMAEWQKQADIAQGGVDTAQTNLTTWQKMQQMRTAEEKEQATTADRNLKIQTDAAQKEEERKRRIYDVSIKGREDSVIPLTNGRQAPAGWEVINHPEGGQVAIPPAISPLPAELVPFFPGKKAGDPVSAQQMNEGMKAFRAEKEKLAVQDNKPDPAAKENENQWIADAQSSDPAVASVAQKKLNAAAKQHAADHPSTVLQLGNALANSPDAVETAATQYRQTRTMPPIGRNPVMAIAILKRVAEKDRAEGISPDQSGVNAELFKANRKALDQQTVAFNQVSGFERTATKNLDLAESVSQQVDRAGSPLVNKYLLYLKGTVAGDTDTIKLHNAVSTAAREYARVISGGMGNAQVTDSTAKEAETMLNASFSKGTFSAVIAQMKKEMGNRNQGFGEQLDSLKKNMVGGNGNAATPAQPPGGAAPAPAQKTATAADIQAYTQAHPGMTVQQATKLFTDKGYVIR